jgi:hypothetical protein
MGERRWWDEARASRVGCPEKGRRRWSCLSRGWIDPEKESMHTMCTPNKKEVNA